MFKKKADSLDKIPQQEKKSKSKGNKKGNKKVVRNVVIVGVVAVIAGLLVMPKLIPADTTPTVAVKAAYKGDVDEILSTSGTVQSEKTKTYYSAASAIITDFTPVVGTVIHEGDQLVSYDTASLEDQYEQAKLQNVASQAGYNSSIAKSNENASKHKNSTTDVDVLNQQATDAQNNVTNLQKALNTASTQLQQKQAEVSADVTDLSTQLQGLKTQLSTETDKDKKAKINEKIDKINTKIDNKNKEVTDIQNYITDLNNQIIDAQNAASQYQSDLAEQESIKNATESTTLTSNDKAQLAASTKVTEVTADAAKANLEKAKQGIVAEFDGVVTAVTGEQGAMAAQGAALFSVASNKDVKLNVTITKYDLDKIKEGQTAEITLAGSTYKGKVSKINRVATNNASGTPVITVEIHIENPDDAIYLGVEADVKIKEASATGVVLIPAEAINTDKDGDFCYVVENNAVVRKAIKTGITSDAEVEIKEGIKEGDQVITTITSDIKEGMKVITMTAEQ